MNPPLSTQRRSTGRALEMTLVPLAIVLVFLLAFGAVSWNISRAPDVFTDEILYTRVASRLADEGALVWDSGKPFLVHPPLYFVAQSAGQQLEGVVLPTLAPGDIFAAVDAARWWNAIFAALTAALLFYIGYRIGGLPLGLGVAILFLLDPFGLRTNRRAMMETFAGLVGLSGMAVLLTARTDRPLSWSRWLAAGVLFGLALLSKELLFVLLLAALLFGLWETIRNARNDRLQGRQHVSLLARLRPLLQAIAASIVAALIYLIYPFWSVLNGGWAFYYGEKFLGLQRMLGLVQITGWNRPGVSLLDFVVERVGDYGSSYLLLALGGLGLLVLLWRGVSFRPARMLASWGLVMYPFFAFLALRGSGNDQFFYFLLLTSCLLLSTAAYLLGSWLASRSGLRQPIRLWLPLVLVLLVFAPWNMWQWYRTYQVNTDDGYAQLGQFLNRSVPPDASINASGDQIKFRYFYPNRLIVAAGTVDEAKAAHVHYFVVAPKDLRAHYGRVTQELADWVTANGQRVFATTGNSYGDIYLYHVDYPAAGPVVMPASYKSDPTGVSFHKATNSYIVPFIEMLGGALVLIGALILAVSAVESRRWRQTTRPVLQPVHFYDTKTVRKQND